jgi:hypothetical protein
VIVDLHELALTRRTLITTFFISILAGGAFQKSLELFYAHGFPVDWSVQFLLSVWGPLVIFLSLLLRFYIGNLLHLRTLESNPPDSMNLTWLYDFCIILLELSVLYFAGMCFAYYNIPRLFRLIAVLLTIDCVWIISMSVLGKIWPRLKRKSIPWLWFWINLPTCIILALTLFYSQGEPAGLSCRWYASTWKMWVVILTFGVSAILDILVDRHFILPRRGWRKSTPTQNQP